MLPDFISVPSTFTTRERAPAAASQFLSTLHLLDFSMLTTSQSLLLHSSLSHFITFAAASIASPQ
jgi:hypothetical protein